MEVACMEVIGSWGEINCKTHFDEDSGTVQAKGEMHGMNLEWGRM